MGENLIKGFMVVNCRCPTCYLQMTLILYDADVEQFRNLCRLHLCLETVSRLKINLEKLETILVGEVANVEELADILDCKVAQLRLSYLGHILKVNIFGMILWKR